MFANNWFGEDSHIDDIDPGKDIFALLFLSFFLINAVILICFSRQSDDSFRVNTSRQGNQKVMTASQLARLMIKNGKISIIQNKKTYAIPENLEQLKKDALFKTQRDNKGKKKNILTLNDPGNTLTAGEMLSVVNMLNKFDIGVDFRPLIKE